MKKAIPLPSAPRATRPMSGFSNSTRGLALATSRNARAPQRLGVNSPTTCKNPGRFSYGNMLPPTIARTSRITEDMMLACSLVLASDGSALLRLRGRPHHAGPFVNVYNERTLAVLARGGVCNVCLPPEMPASAIRALPAEAAKLAVTIEVQ